VLRVRRNRRPPKTAERSAWVVERGRVGDRKRRWCALVCAAADRSCHRRRRQESTPSLRTSWTAPAVLEVHLDASRRCKTVLGEQLELASALTVSVAERRYRNCSAPAANISTITRTNCFSSLLIVTTTCECARSNLRWNKGNTAYELYKSHCNYSTRSRFFAEK